MRWTRLAIGFAAGAERVAAFYTPCYTNPGALRPLPLQGTLGICRGSAAISRGASGTSSRNDAGGAPDDASQTDETPVTQPLLRPTQRGPTPPPAPKAAPKPAKNPRDQPVWWSGNKPYSVSSAAGGERRPGQGAGPRPGWGATRSSPGAGAPGPRALGAAGSGRG
ncbi:hypothetical protein T484DRAFT_1907582, partial [Baffinella frigidus]